jgi:hypothetical protein
MSGSDTDRLDFDDRPRRQDDDDRPRAGAADRVERRPRSFFWPVVLITVGVVLLLSNLGIIAAGSWQALVRLWPLLLVLAGLDLLFAGRMPLVGTLLGLAMGAAVVGLLLWGHTGWFEEQGGLWGPLASLFSSVEVESQELSLSLERTESVQLALAPGQFGAKLHTEVDPDSLLAGTVFYAGELGYDVRGQGAEREVSLRDQSGYLPGFWLGDGVTRQWDLGLSPAVALALTVDGGSGPVELALDGSALERLTLDAGSGPATVTLPPRAVEAAIEGGSGPLSVRVPTGGRLAGDVDLGSGPTSFDLDAGSHLSLRLETGSGPVTIALGDDVAAEIDLIEAGSGPFTLELPQAAAVRVLVEEGGSGRLSLPRELGQISDGGDDDPDTGAWETDGYAEATVRVLLRARDMGSGPVNVRFD